MKSVRSIGGFLVVAILSGCQVLPQAGLIYSSTQTVGVGVKISGTDGAAPVDLSVGVKIADVAYVPVVTSTGAAGSATLITGRHGNTAGEVATCITAVASANRAAVAAAPQASPNVCDMKIDALSVYGQFSTNAAASAADKSGGILAGKVFATGVAAQNVSSAATVAGTAECVKSVTAAESDPAKRNALIDKLCSPRFGN